MMIYLAPELQKILSPAQKQFNYFMQLKGESFRALEGRRTQRITLAGEDYFIKQHVGIGWKEIIKNLLQGKRPIFSAKNEWQAIQRLQALAVATPYLMAYGCKGLNPARIQSFVLMKALTATISLEDFCCSWKKNPPAFSLKLTLIRQVAQIAKTLHDHGINHRDFYLCHFLLSTTSDRKLYLIDLHRAGLHRYLRNRWIIKDLAGLYFSSKDLGLTQHDLWHFMKAYHQQPLRTIIKNRSALWQKIKKRGEKLYAAHA